MNVNDALKSASRSATASRASKRTQSALVVSEVCLSLVLVAGAALLARSFWNLRSDRSRVPAPTTYWFRMLRPPMARCRQPLRNYGDLLARIRAIPGGRSRRLGLQSPHRRLPSRWPFQYRRQAGAVEIGRCRLLRRQPWVPERHAHSAARGRDFNDGDTENGQHVAVINQEMARVYFHGADPIGQRIWFDSFNRKENWLVIVGVAGDTRQSSLTKSVDPLAYVLYTQQTDPGILADGNLVVRTRSTLPASQARCAAPSAR